MKIKSFKTNKIYVGNCLEKMKELPSNSVDLVFADPPYNYEEYQELKNLVCENNLVKKDGVLIIEHNKETSFVADNIELRKYGTVHFSVFSF